jgi:hypothetical protein
MLQDSSLAEHLDEQHHVDDQAEQARGHVARGEQEDIATEHHQSEHHDQPEPRCEQVLAEENRPRLGEDGEQRHEDLVEGLHRRQEHQHEKH